MLVQIILGAKIVDIVIQLLVLIVVIEDVDMDVVIEEDLVLNVKIIAMTVIKEGHCASTMHRTLLFLLM